MPSADHDRQLKLMRRAVTLGEMVPMVSLVEELRAVGRVRMESQRLTACPTNFPELEIPPLTTTHNTGGDNKPA
ncbi:hypothetical protein QFZ24_000151 [Streptomyces phaeochromogenes]|nr:hypothetical protein [Streptomyces phaeochromogenes]